jgi:hypothetical protein
LRIELLTGLHVDFDDLAILRIAGQQMLVGGEYQASGRCSNPPWVTTRPVPALVVRVVASAMATIRLPSASDT